LGGTRVVCHRERDNRDLAQQIPSLHGGDYSSQTSGQQTSRNDFFLEPSHLSHCQAQFTNGPPTQVIIDSGSNISLVSTRLLEKLNPFTPAQAGQED